MIGFQFTPFKAGENNKTMFEQMLDLFTELLNYTNWDATEALDWLNQLDRPRRRERLGRRLDLLSWRMRLI